MKKYDVVVVGAGAAGLFAAINAAKNNNSVLIVEKNNSAGKKLLITGKGRCNLSNHSSINNYMNNIFPNPKFLYQCFNNFFVEDLINFFENKNIEIKLERGNRLFPKSDKSSDILNCLIKTCNDKNIDFLYNANLNEILIKNNIIDSCNIIKNKETINIKCSNIILCTGGASYPTTGSNGDGYKIAKKLGHTITTIKPSLVGLIPKSDIFDNVKIIKLKNINSTIYINNKKANTYFGEVEIYKNLISGPSILHLSRNAVEAIYDGKNVDLSLDFKPALNYEKLNTRLINDFNKFPKLELKELLKQLLPKDFIPIFIKILSINGNKLANQLSANDRKKILSLLKDFKIEIKSDEGFNRAVITNGGISTKEVNPKTMESNIISNLYFAGEILDIDANTGGYNLQIAFSTAWTAGNSIRKK